MRPLTAERVAVLERLEGIAKHLDEVLEKAQREGTPEQKQLAVRKGQRLITAIAKKAQAITRIGEPEPWMTAPTRERVEQAGEAPVRTLVGAEGVSHRWQWPVQILHNFGMLKPEAVMAATRLNTTYYRLGKQPATMDYAGALQATDPTTRLPILEHQEGAWGEFAFVMKRLTTMERCWVWALVLQAPFNGEAEAPNAATLATRVFEVRTVQLARYLSYGILIATLDRVQSAYQHFDIQRRQRDATSRQRMIEEHAKHIERVPQTRVRLPT